LGRDDGLGMFRCVQRAPLDLQWVGAIGSKEVEYAKEILLGTVARIEMVQLDRRDIGLSLGHIAKIGTQAFGIAARDFYARRKRQGLPDEPVSEFSPGQYHYPSHAVSLARAAGRIAEMTAKCKPAWARRGSPADFSGSLPVGLALGEEGFHALAEIGAHVAHGHQV